MSCHVFAAACDVATILLREALDRVRGLPNKDWNKKFHMAVDPLHAAVEKAKLTSAEDRWENAPPSHSLEAYEGIYSADGYPPFEVKLDQDQLYARTIGSLAWSDLRHYHYDVFEWHLSSWNARMKAKFLVNAAGEVASVLVPIEPAVDDIVFVRKPVVLDATTLSALAGDYATAVDGLVFNVTTKNGKLYWQESGQPFREAIPCADRGAEIECRIRRMLIEPDACRRSRARGAQLKLNVKCRLPRNVTVSFGSYVNPESGRSDDEGTGVSMLPLKVTQG